MKNTHMICPFFDAGQTFFESVYNEERVADTQRIGANKSNVKETCHFAKARARQCLVMDIVYFFLFGQGERPGLEARVFLLHH